jgi:hypothetical protein
MADRGLAVVSQEKVTSMEMKGLSQYRGTKRAVRANFELPTQVDKHMNSLVLFRSISYVCVYTNFQNKHLSYLAPPPYGVLTDWSHVERLCLAIMLVAIMYDILGGRGYSGSELSSLVVQVVHVSLTGRHIRLYKLAVHRFSQCTGRYLFWEDCILAHRADFSCRAGGACIADGATHPAVLQGGDPQPLQPGALLQGWLHGVRGARHHHRRRRHHHHHHHHHHHPHHHHHHHFHRHHAHCPRRRAEHLHHIIIGRHHPSHSFSLRTKPPTPNHRVIVMPQVAVTSAPPCIPHMPSRANRGVSTDGPEPPVAEPEAGGSSPRASLSHQSSLR